MADRAFAESVTSPAMRACSLLLGASALYVYMPDNVPRAKLTVEDGMVTLAGAGCDRTIDLPR